jgi:hypothetical protein
MARFTSKLFLTFCITAIVALGADNSIGTWKLNVEKSTYSLAPFPLKSLTMTREVVPGGARVTTVGLQADGTAVNSTVTVSYDGKEAKVAGAPWDSISVKQVDSNTFTSVTKHSTTKYNATSRTVVSRDGKTMTTTIKGTNTQGQPLTATFVYERQ